MPILLLPPSEGKAPGGQRGVQAATFAQPLGPARRAVRAAVGELLECSSREQLSKKLGAQGDLLDRACAAMTMVARNRPPLLPAWQRYTGVVFEHLGAGSLSDSQRRRLLIVSGVYGVTTAEDLVADYRLKMNITLPTVGVVGRFLREPTTRAIQGYGSGPVVDLLPTEHRSAVDFERLEKSREVITVRFLAAGGAKAAGHAAKAVKGDVARYLTKHGVRALPSAPIEGWSIVERSHGYDVVAAR